MDHKANGKTHEGIHSLRIPIGLMLVLTFFYLIAAYFFPIVQDEAYYYNWGKNLALGYFDHPPAVAWLSSFSQLFGAHFLHGRTGTVLVASLSLFLMFRLYRLCCFPSEKKFHTACVLGACNAAAIICGFLTTPDAIIMFAWILALHEAASAMLGKPWRWLTAGAAVGLGLLGKYTMLLIGPIFLTSLVFSSRKQLSTKWPYLGGFVALLVFAPNLIWNQQNAWLTWNFQLKHGLAQHRSDLVSGHLPGAEKPEEGSPEMQLADLFSPLPKQARSQIVLYGEPSEKLEAIDKLLGKVKGLSKADSVSKRLSEFFSGQIALWGALLFVLIGSAFFRIRSNAKLANDPMPYSLKVLMVSACLWPIVVFGLFSLNGKVEANWAAMYLVGAAPLLAHYLRPNLTLSIIAACINLLLIAGIVSYTNHPFVRVNPGFDRILMETHGFRDLAHLPDLQEQGDFFADSFQLVSMLRYYNPALNVGQWPGITRTSEFVHNEKIWSPFDLSELTERKEFYLVTTDDVPPKISGFSPVDLKLIQDCREGYLKEQSSWLDLDARACGVLHRWYLVVYKKV